MGLVLELAAVGGGSFVIALSGAMMPGPLLTVTVAESARSGLRAGPLLITGHGILELALVVAVVKGLAPVLRSPGVMAFIAAAGGAMLLWMGIGMLKGSGSLSLASPEGATGRPKRGHPVIVGILASLANPYWTLWWATIGLGYLVAAMKFGIAGVVVFFAGHLAADYGWYALVSLGVSRGKRFMSDRAYRNLIRACAVFLIVFGGWFLTTARGYALKVLG